MKLPTEIVIGSGGARGIVALGAIWELQKAGYFKDATAFSGSSIGAVISAALALGVNLPRMMRVAARYPLEPDISPKNFGMDSGKGLAKFIRRMLCLKKLTTLKDVYDTTGNTLRICVCNVTDRCVEYWTHETHPEMSILKALRISCSIPLIFSAVKFRNKLYVDGAVADPLPLPRGSLDRTLAIGFETPTTPVETMQEFVEAVQTMRVPPPVPRYYLKIDPGDLDQFNFTLDAKTLKDAFARGQTQASSWIKKNV